MKVCRETRFNQPPGYQCETVCQDGVRCLQFSCIHGSAAATTPTIAHVLLNKVCRNTPARPHFCCCCALGLRGDFTCNHRVRWNGGPMPLSILQSIRHGFSTNTSLYRCPPSHPHPRPAVVSCLPLIRVCLVVVNPLRRLPIQNRASTLIVRSYFYPLLRCITES